MIGFSFTLDEQHGFGIQRESGQDQQAQPCFYEDGTLVNRIKIPGMDRAIAALSWYTSDNREGSRSKAGALKKQMNKDSCCFSVIAGSTLCVNLTIGDQKYEIQSGKSNNKYYDTQVRCSCGKYSCPHLTVAADFMEKRLDALRHEYVVTDLPVDKSLFLEKELMQRTRDLDVSEYSTSEMKEIRGLIQMLNSAKSDDYYWNYYRFILKLTPLYSAYDSQYLENNYPELWFALFEIPGFQKAVVEDERFLEPERYEGRQEKSNRVCTKRIWKDYQRAIKALDVKANYEEHYCKEFLLKYRSDWPGLFRYYAEGKPSLKASDLPYLAEIAKAPELDPDYLLAVAVKMDKMDERSDAEPVLRRLTAKVPQENRVDIYSRLRSLSLPVDEIRGLDRESQMKMIRNIPLTVESFRYIMDDLMAQSDPVEKGRFLLHVTETIYNSRDTRLKAAVLERIAQVPDNRLLFSYATLRLGAASSYTPERGDPEKELKSYFTCVYEIVRNEKQMYVKYSVCEPENRGILMFTTEQDGMLKSVNTAYAQLNYAPELIRKVCLEGKEEAYKKAFEENQDALATTLFEKDQKKFAREYRQLCESLTDGKILYTDGGKVGIEWLIYREGGSNALAFKVGNTRMYVVKDALEFIDSFRKGATTEYGKDLVLTHDPDNLKESDAGLVKLLMAGKYTRGRPSEPNNRRYIRINDALLGNLLEGLEGRTVSYNDKPCRIRMEPREIRLNINSRYELATNLSRSNQEFLNLVGKGYLVTKRMGSDGFFLDRVEGPAEEINLISLVDENPSVSIKPILKDFRKNIYARFFDKFDVEKSVQRDFTLSQIRLNTYFDYVNGVITAKTVILRDETEIREELLTDRIDRAKLELLETYLQGLGFEEGTLSDEGRVLAFFKMDFTKLKSLTNVYLSENLKNKELKSVGKPVIRVTYQNNLIRVFLEKSDFTEEELEQIIAGLRKKRKYILLSKDRIVDLDSDTARDFGETVMDFDMDPKDLYKKKTISMINAIKAFSHERSCRVDKYLRDMIEEIRSFKDADIPVPRLNAELRDYQTDGFRWMTILSKYGMGGILADDMGLGKTIQVIALIRSDRARKPSLVVCPKSLVFNWMSEFARFDGTTRVTAIYGPDKKRSEMISAIDEKEKAVYITSYDSMRNDVAKYSGAFNYVILDEAQYIKNVNALKTKSVKELNASHRFALTGTPIENSVVDLWSIFDFIMPGYFEELSRFKESETAVIARKAGPFILRRVKEDVLDDLPPKYERILSADMTDGQRKLYDAMRMEARQALDAGGKAFDLLPYLTRLRQVCVDPGMFVENYTGGSGKLDMLSTLIPEYLEAHHRILIFSQFVKALESVKEMLAKKSIDTWFLTGATPAKDRVEMMDNFNNGSGADVFLISLKAGGTGLNLTGADTVIHLDPWWNVAAENQASDRTHRIGQTRNVEVIRLIASESIEQRVVELQDMKKEVIKQVISDDEGSVTSAKLEDIAFVLE